MADQPAKAQRGRDAYLRWHSRCGAGEGPGEPSSPPVSLAASSPGLLPPLRANAPDSRGPLRTLKVRVCRPYRTPWTWAASASHLQTKRQSAGPHPPALPLCGPCPQGAPQLHEGDRTHPLRPPKKWRVSLRGKDQPCPSPSLPTEGHAQRGPPGSAVLNLTRTCRNVRAPGALNKEPHGCASRNITSMAQAHPPPLWAGGAET